MTKRGKATQNAKRKSKPRDQVVIIASDGSKSRQLVRSKPTAGPLPQYVDLISNPVEYISDARNIPRNPNSAGTTTFVGSACNTIDFRANARVLSPTGIDTSKAGGLIVATNGVTGERLLVTAGADQPLITQLNGEFIVQVVKETAITTGDAWTGSIEDNFVDGIVECGVNSSTTECYVAALPNLSGRPAFWLANQTTAATSFSYNVRIPEYIGNVEFILYTLSGGVWTAQVTSNLAGATSKTGTWNTTGNNEFEAMAFSLVSSVQQQVKLYLNLYANTSTSLYIFQHTNLLVPVTSQFQPEINSDALREYWPTAAGEVITNVTNPLQRQGTAYGVSTQRFAGLYNANDARNMAELITYNKIHYYSGEAAHGLSGHSIPRYMQPEPLPFHFRGYAGDCRMYYIESASANPQEFKITFATAVCALGKRTSSISYGVTHFPKWWDQVVLAVAYINPISCNPGHSAMFGKAMKYIKEFISNPDNIRSIIDGFITGGEIAEMALASVAPRISGAAGQASSLLKLLR